MKYRILKLSSLLVVASFSFFLTGCEWSAVFGGGSIGTATIRAPDEGYTYNSYNVQQYVELSSGAIGAGLHVESDDYPEDVWEWSIGDTLGTNTYSSFEQMWHPPYNGDFSTGGAGLFVNSQEELIWEESDLVGWTYNYSSSKPTATVQESFKTNKIHRNATKGDFENYILRLRPGYVQEQIALYEKATSLVGTALVHEGIRKYHPNLLDEDITLLVQFAKNPNSRNRSRESKPIALGRNFPDPFNPATAIPYTVDSQSPVPISLEIYNVNGQLIRSLVNGIKSPGNYLANWDGKDNYGKSVSSGVYLYRLESQGHFFSEKMILAK